LQILRYTYLARDLRKQPLAQLGGPGSRSPAPRDPDDPWEVTVSTSSPIELASGQVTTADRLAVILIKPTGSPAVILIKWPTKPSVVEASKLQGTVAKITRVLASAQIGLAARRAAGL
jgi:hypothetical protein